jgi:predicted GNAT family N-acyltransferase
MTATSHASEQLPVNISIAITDWQHDQDALSDIRRRVFIEEQHVPEEMEWDGEDNDAIHFIARDHDNRALGCVRLLPSGQISRLSVLEAARNQGIGKALVGAAETEARRRGMSEVFLHAQTQATHFYESEGFTVTGGIFLEAGIPHRQMFKDLQQGS